MAFGAQGQVGTRAAQSRTALLFGTFSSYSLMPEQVPGAAFGVATTEALGVGGYGARPAAQFSTSVIGVFWLRALLTRKRCPSGETS